MANSSYENPNLQIQQYKSPTKQVDTNVYDRIRQEKKSQEQLRKKLIQDRITQQEKVMGKLQGETTYTFDKNTNLALNSLVDDYIVIKNGMMKSEGEEGYVSTQLGMDALRQIEEQANDIAFFNNQLSKDLLPELRKMILKPSNLGYDESKGAMSSIVPTTAQEIVMAVNNNNNVTWEFTEDGELELVMLGKGEDGKPIRFNLNQYGKYIEQGQEFFTAIPDIDDELTAAAEVVIGTPGQPKIVDGLYYTYDTTTEGGIDFSTVQITDENRKRAIDKIIELQQFEDLLTNPNRANERQALWQDCVTIGDQEGFGQDSIFDDENQEQIDILHRWLATKAVDKNLTGTQVTGMSRKSGDPGGGGGSAAFTNAELKNIAQYKPQYDANVKLVNEIFAEPKFQDIGKFPDQVGLKDLVKELNKFIDFTKFGGFKLASEMTQNERDQDVKNIAGEEVSVDNNTIVFIDANGKPKVIPLDFNDPEVMLNFLNQQTIGDEKIIYNLSTLYGGQDKKQTTEKDKSETTFAPTSSGSDKGKSGYARKKQG
tara:strand:- start:865 stop:2487 length:1623 start_codon:yes stop_codon:yes gene_type:complete